MPALQHNTLADIPGLKIGQAEDRIAETGVTVVVPDQPATAAVVTLGGAPGTRETEALSPTNLVGRVEAIVLTGGSVYGLGAADRIATLLGAARRGYGLVADESVPVSPIVPAAVLYDLNKGDKRWGTEPPYARLGQEALERAAREVTLGSVGAGCGAWAGARKGGIGSASARLPSGHTIGALIAVNSFGSVFVPGTEQFWAAPFEVGDEFGARGVAQARAAGFPSDTKVGVLAASADQGPRMNTTIGVLATDLPLTRADAERIGIMAHDGFARAIRPAHGPLDGDTLFVLSTGSGEDKRAEPLDPITLSVVGTIAGDVTTRAIARGVFAAR